MSCLLGLGLKFKPKLVGPVCAACRGCMNCKWMLTTSLQIQAFLHFIYEMVQGNNPAERLFPQKLLHSDASSIQGKGAGLQLSLCIMQKGSFTVEHRLTGLGQRENLHSRCFDFTTARVGDTPNLRVTVLSETGTRDKPTLPSCATPPC